MNFNAPLQCEQTRYNLGDMANAVAQVSAYPFLHSVTGTGSVVFNGEGNDCDVLASTTDTLRGVAQQLIEDGWSLPPEAMSYLASGDWVSLRRGYVNLIVCQDIRPWMEAREACIALATVQPITKKQRAVLHWIIRDKIPADKVAEILDTMGEDYV